MEEIVGAEGGSLGPDSITELAAVVSHM